MKRIVCDVDGVLADWNTAFRQLLIDAGAELQPFANGSLHPHVWDWPTQLGATEAQIGQAKAQQVEAWWMHLEPVEDFTMACSALLGHLCRTQEVTFVTSRSTPGVRNATEWWLRRYVGKRHVHVVVVPSGDKTGVLQGIQPDVVIEDHLPTLINWAYEQSTARGCVLVERPYNQPHSCSAIGRDVPITRVPSTLAALRLAETECQ